MTEISRISCVIGTAGHIDHGKTSLVKALTGIDTDRLSEEKRRGVSIDLGFAYMDIDGPGGVKARVAVVDVPGHERFIRNMLAGTTGIDLVVFVIAADDGVMPQTLEHLDIIHLLGVKKGVFVITKADLASDARVSGLKRDIDELLKDTALKGSPVIAASTVTGMGVEEIKKHIVDFAVSSSRAVEGGFFRLPVDRSFTIKGFGAVITGTVASGSIKKGDEAVLFPSGAKIKVRGIQSLYLSADAVSEGQRAALNLSGVDHTDVERGMVLISSGLGELLRSNGEFMEAALSRHRHIDCFFEFTSGHAAGKNRVIKNRSLLKVHHQTDESLATILFAGKKEAAPGGPVFGRLVLKKPLLMLRGDRFIIRDPSVNATIGGGTVHLAYFSKHLMPRIGKITIPDKKDGAGGVLLGLLPEKGLGFEKKTLSLMLNLPASGFARSADDKEFVQSGEFIVSIKRLDELKNRIMEHLASFHRERPMEAGAGEEALFKALKAGFASGLPAEKAQALFKEVLGGLVSSKVIKRENGAYSSAAHLPRAKGVESKVEEAIIKLFSKGFAPPGLEEIGRLPFGKGEVDKVMVYLQRGGVIVKLKEGSFISGDALALAKLKLAAHIREKGGIKASEFRDILGCGRKLAIEILEYFDKERVTLRQGDIRTLR